ILRREPALRLPAQCRPLAADQAPRDVLRVPRVDQGAERAGRPEGEPAELEARRGRNRAFLDEVHGDGAHVRVLLAVEHFEAVDDRPDRADHIMADPRAEKRGQIERGERDGCQSADPMVNASGDRSWRIRHVSDSPAGGDNFRHDARFSCARRHSFLGRGIPLSTSARPFDFGPAAPEEIALFLAEAALAAGPAVMEVYAQGCGVRAKDDGSPVTLADQRSEAIVCENLARAVPQIPVVAEESTAEGKPVACGERFLLVDPLDGTKEFIARNGEFTINVALIEKGRPIAGAVYAPALARLWFGGEAAFVCEAAVGAGLPERRAWRPIRARPAPDALVCLASRSHADAATEAFLARLPVANRLSRGSSLKFCVIAEGAADVYPRFGQTMEWD